MKRALLSLLTLISLIPFLLSLLGSFGELQVQGELQLSQTNLLLTASHWRSSTAPSWQNSVLGQAPYLNARQEYKTIVQELEAYNARIENQLLALPPSRASLTLVEVDPQNQRLQEIRQQNQQTLQRLNLNLGLLEIQENLVPQALERWQALANSPQPSPAIAATSQILVQLWQNPPQAGTGGVEVLTANLQGWFQNQALKRFYQVANQPLLLTALEQKEQSQAQQALIKLAILSGLPLLGGCLGVLLLLGLLAQWLLKGEQALLARHARLPWSVPWTWETIWQVLLLGFLFLGQVLLPLIISLLPWELGQLDLQGKALYVLWSYLILAVAGWGVLFFSLKPYFPLPADWFRFQFNLQALGWGIGGYWVALPLVVLVSWLNQVFWQGQGGSNPLLSLALQAQDRLVLFIFFFTATLLAPLFEETLFRGFLLPSLTRYVSVPLAIGLSSLGFAVAHLNVSEILPLLMLGLILGTVYTRSRNLLASILVHGLWNSGTLISLFLLGS